MINSIILLFPSAPPSCFKTYLNAKYVATINKTDLVDVNAEEWIISVKFNCDALDVLNPLRVGILGSM